MGKPVELFAQRVLTAFLARRGHAISFDALLDVGRVAAVEGLDLLVVDLPHVLADLVQKPAVVGNYEKGARPLWPAGLEVVGEPADGMHVEMVRGLVHEDNVPGPHKEPSKVAATALAARERPHGCIPVDVAQKLRDYLTHTRV